jgi:NIMA (never in mitosis gene a)-related kinase
MSLNDFIVGKFLGKGAFGSVCLVTRKADKKIYAMKSINIGKLDQNQREASLNEIRILASLNHPNIIGYKEAFYDENSRTLNIIMEYADDGDINHKIQENLKRRLQFEESQVWEWIIQLLKGLKYLHDNKIMHRDLKCANIFLMKNGLVKIGDLNVSKITKSNMARTQTGTPYYIAPEIWKDKPYDYKCDIWSLGCIIYEICTSRPPFRGTSLAELGNNILRGYYLPFSGFSNDIKNLIAKMLIVDPNKRASINELLNSEIIKRKINSLGGNNIINIKDNSKKANLIKTIKLPRNMKEINLALPKNRYSQKESMMENDPYEKTKNIYMETINKLKEEKKEINNKQKNQLEVIVEKPNIIKKNDNNNYNNNIGKYNYLNKYDNNMQLKKEEKNKNIIIKPQINKPSSNQKANRYRDFYKDDDLPTNNNLNKIIQNKKPVVNNKINRYGFNNYNQRERGWFKNNYPDFKYQRPKRAANCKVNYNQINYKDYCLKNKIDKKMNYHYYRENGYYNYNKAINDHVNKYDNLYKGVNLYKKGPYIANIKP